MNRGWVQTETPRPTCTHRQGCVHDLETRTPPRERNNMTTPRTGKPAGRTKKPVNSPRFGATTSFAALQPPEGLSSYGVDVWNRLWSAGQHYLSPTQDRLLVEKLCRKLDVIRRLEDWLSVDVERRWYTTANGQTVTHPAVKQVEQADAQATAWLSMLGFSPSDRARLGLPKQGDVNPFRELHDKIAARRAGNI
jgi:P27 family predicted phage terminase small subunit